MKIKLLEDYILESKADIQRFIDKFGQGIYDRLQKNKQRILNKTKDPKTVDITYLVKNASIEDIEKILSSAEDVELDVEGRPIPKPTNTKETYEEDGWKIYFITDVEDMINIGRDTGWCIAGKYDTEDTKVSQAKQYFNEYKDELGLDGYFVLVSPEGEKYCVLTDHKSDQIHSVWDSDDYELDVDEFLRDSVPAGVQLFFDYVDYRKFPFLYYDGFDENEISDDVVELDIQDDVSVIRNRNFAYLPMLKRVNIPDSVERIESEAFCEDPLEDVYYGGTKEQWDEIDIDKDNEELFNARIHFNDDSVEVVKKITE